MIPLTPVATFCPVRVKFMTMSVNHSISWSKKISRAQVDIFKCLVLSNQQSKNQQIISAQKLKPKLLVIHFLVIDQSPQLYKHYIQRVIFTQHLLTSFCLLKLSTSRWSLLICPGDGSVAIINVVFILKILSLKS